MLLKRASVSVLEAVEILCGLQAQEPKPPHIGLWTRLNQFAVDDLTSALHSRHVVRATMMRGTLHVVSARDYIAFRMVLQPMLTQALRVLGDRAHGLDLVAVLSAAHTLLLGAPRTFDELRTDLSRQFPEVNERALGYVTRMNIPLVMAPTQDHWGFPSIAAFTLAETWLNETLSAGHAPDHLVRRYLAAFGPASVADVQEWSGLTGLKAVLHSMRGELRAFRDETGRELFDLPDAPRPDAEMEVPVRYLPEFDNLVLAHSDRTRVIADKHRALVVTKNLRVNATFLVDGFVAGTWRITRKKKAATLQLSPFEALSTENLSDLHKEGENLVRFVEADASSVDVLIEAPRTTM